MQPLCFNLRAIAMSVEAEQHIHQSAAALSAAQIDRSTMFPVAPFSKIQHSTQLFCCSCLFPCVAIVTRSTCVSCKPRFFLFVVSCPSCLNSYPQCRNHAAPKTSAGTNENQIKQDQKPVIRPRAHICTYVCALTKMQRAHVCCNIQVAAYEPSCSHATPSHIQALE